MTITWRAPADLFKEVRSQAAGIRQFIVDKNLMTLSARDNMKIVETPSFLRGVYSVAGFHAPPPLDPQAEGLWVTPISADTPKAAAESKLREYNNWMLQYLTMHEALPGHYTQFEHANDVQPPERRLIRALLSDGAYVEGWGEYGVKEMVDAGYAGNDPRFVLMVLKIRMRVIANTILDIRMQTTQMTDAEALIYWSSGLPDACRSGGQAAPRQADSGAVDDLLHRLPPVDCVGRDGHIRRGRRCALRSEAFQRCRAERRCGARAAVEQAAADAAVGAMWASVSGQF